MKISNKVKTVAAGTAGVVAMGLNSTASVHAADVLCPNGTVSSTGDLNGCDTVTAHTKDTNMMETVNIIINVVIGLIGFVAVVVIILGGFQYSTSAGDPGKVTKAKNTILYGIVGLVIALLAFAIVNFVLASVFNSNS